ncbi:MAG TPA: hypothetical protein ENK88_00560 [Campylobacterales bacterium]|nr:hypothetical protein [Campylobacterales bacterium]
MKISLYMLFLSMLFLFNGCENHKKIDNNTTKIVKLAQVNEHTITNKVLGKKAEVFFTLNEIEKKNLIDKLVDDELLLQYIFKERNQSKIEDENFRAKRGLQLLEAKSLSTTLALVDKNISVIYQKDKEKYKHNELIEASNILVETKKEATDIIKELQQTSDFNSTFVKIAKEKSIGKVAKNGGYLGFFEKKYMPKPFQKALESLKVNSYTKEPIKTKYGYHVIYLHSINPAGYFSLEEVKREIVLDTNRKRMNKWAYTKLKALKKDAKIKLYP